MKKTITAFFGFLIIGIIIYIIYWLGSNIVEQFKLLDPKTAIAILTAATTIFASTIAVVLGKYYERQKEIEAHYREKKILIYDEFLKEFFNLMELGNKDEGQDKFVNFLREWQRKMILWGGQDVLSQYLKWMTHLKTNEPDAKTMYITEDFFREIRKDLGHKSNKLDKGSFIYLLLQNTELFFTMSKENPNITLAEIAKVEEALKANKSLEE